jgi:hypothetical protein
MEGDGWVGGWMGDAETENNEKIYESERKLRIGIYKHTKHRFSHSYLLLF